MDEEWINNRLFLLNLVTMLICTDKECRIYGGGSSEEYREIARVVWVGTDEN